MKSRPKAVAVRRSFFHHHPDALGDSVPAAALAYEECGLNVVKLYGNRLIDGQLECECPKGSECKSPGKHPRASGWNTSRLTASEVAREFKSKNANVGLAMGGEGRLVALDIDGPDGERSLAKWEAEHGALPPTLTSRSGREEGGRHLIFKVPAGHDLASIKNKVAAAPCIDVRSEGGQIVVSPSRHATGRLYRWEELATPAPIPEWLWIKLVGASTRKKASAEQSTTLPPEVTSISLEERIERALTHVKRMPPGISGNGGHHATFRAALACGRGFCLPLADSLAVLEEVFNPRCMPPWAPADLEHKVASAISDGNLPYGYLLGARMTIDVSDDEHRIIEDAVAALSLDENIFQRAGTLVRVCREETSMGAVSRILPFNTSALREPLSRNAKFVRQNKSAAIPSWLPGAVLQRKSWPVRTIRRVVDVPILRADGSVVGAPGYDEETGFYLASSIKVGEVSPNPSLEEVQKACRSLRGVWRDFPFASEEHVAATLAALLTPFARGVFAGPSPLIAIDGTTRGIGKGLLVDTISSIAFGISASRMAQAENEPEQRKAITSIAAAAKPLVLIDNVVEPLGGAALDAALTSESWEDRVLHTNSIVQAPLEAQWFATGNNIRFRGDTARRVLHVRLASREERPEERQDFRHPDLLVWIRKNRPRLVRAALTILSGYLRAGGPQQEMVAWGSFEGWSKIVRGAVIWCGLPDPANTRARLMEESDREPSLVKVVFSVMRMLQKDSPEGILCQQIVTLSPSASGWPSAGRCESLDAALRELVPTSSERPFVDARRLGKKFEALRERVFGGWKVVRAGKTQGTMRWKVIQATPPPTSEKEEDKGSKGSVSKNMKGKKWVIPSSTITGEVKRK